MSEYAAVSSLSEFASLDIGEFGAGVVAFALDEPEPTNVTRSHWAGWRAAAMEAGAIPQDGVLILLAVEAALDCDFEMRGFG